MRRLALGLAAALLLLSAGCGAAPGSVGGACRQADAGAAGECNPGLECLQLMACDPPQTTGPDCGEKCVDCSHPADSIQANACTNQTP